MAKTKKQEPEVKTETFTKTLVYKCPGVHQMPGGTYSYLPVSTQEQLKAAIDDGYFATLAEAVEFHELDKKTAG